MYMCRSGSAYNCGYVVNGRMLIDITDTHTYINHTYLHQYMHFYKASNGYKTIKVNNTFSADLQAQSYMYTCTILTALATDCSLHLLSDN